MTSRADTTTAAPETRVPETPSYWALALVTAFLVAVALTIGTPDTGAEDIGNWFHARLFFEDWGFINLAKSAVYQIYLMPFSFLPYPESIVLERFISVFIGFTLVAWSLMVFFGAGIGLMIALATAPDILLTTPTSQVFAVALAFSAFATRLRRRPDDARTIANFYLMLLASWAFRSNTILILACALAWDAWLLHRARAWRALFHRHVVKACLPILVMMTVIGVFAIDQSPHRWNNYQLLENQWQPPKGQIATVMSHTIANYNKWKDPDTGGVPFTVYHQHARFFGTATTIGEMLVANPLEIAGHIVRNAGAVMVTLTSMTNIGQSLLRYTALNWSGSDKVLFDHRIVGVAGFLIITALFGAAVWLAFRMPGRQILVVLLIGMAATVGVSGLLTNGSSTRILYPAYPLMALVLGVCCRFVAGRFFGTGGGRTGIVLTVLLVATFSQIGWARADIHSGWAGPFRRVAAAAAGDTELWFHSGERAAVYRRAEEIIDACHGLMPAALPHDLFAFGHVPVDKLYSPFEIPPYGSLGDSPYDGLRPDRIDCLFIPNNIRQPGESITNIKRRFEYYIRPYGERLIAQGARVLPTPLGDFIVPDSTQTRNFTQ